MRQSPSNSEQQALIVKHHTVSPFHLNLSCIWAEILILLRVSKRCRTSPISQSLKFLTNLGSQPLFSPWVAQTSATLASLGLAILHRLGKVTYNGLSSHQLSSQNLILSPFPNRKLQSCFKKVASLFIAFQRLTQQLPLLFWVNQPPKSKSLSPYLNLSIKLLFFLMLDLSRLQLFIFSYVQYCGRLLFFLLWHFVFPVNKMYNVHHVYCFSIIFIMQQSTFNVIIRYET